MDKNAILIRMYDIHYRYAEEIKCLCDQFCITGENGVLCRLHIHEGRLSSGELAETMGLTSGRIANILKSLERKGMVQRERDSRDRRHVIAVLTDQGREKINSIFDKNNEIIEKVLERLDIQEVREGLSIFEKVVDILRGCSED